ncbi:MAG: hypothetical protein IMY70_05490 [Bacteroidetes bacterium]|nr:hypothetical protein [Bacteroidota bacterium]
MKKAIFIIVLTLTILTTFSQKWEHTIGQPNHYEASRRVIEHYDKGYVISAQYDDLGWLVKTDINGNVLWDKVLGIDPDQVITEKTIFDEQGNMYLFGTMLQDIEPFWPLVIKLNACGEKQWCKLMYQNEYEYGSFSDALLLENGDLLALANMPDAEQHDMIYLFCISPDGEYKWKKSYASKDNYPFFSMRLGSRIQHFDDIYIISGYVYSPYPGGDTNHVFLRPMFIGIDTLFNEQWVVEFGIADSMLGKALTSIPINDSLFMGVGRYRYVDSTGQTKDAWAMYYNAIGEQVGYQVITKDKLGSEVNESTFFEIERINDSIFLATSGYFYGEDDDGAMGEIVFDTAGNVYNYAIREGTSGGNTSLVKTFDDKYAIATSYRYPNLTYDVYFYKINENLEHDTVYPGSYTYDSLCTNLPIQSGVIDLAGCDIITGLEEIPSLEDYNNNKNTIVISAYPNPANKGTITLEFKNTEYFEDMELRCFDVFGEEVHEERVYPYQGESVVYVNGWGKGIYVGVVYSDGLPVGSCKFIIR